jgi:hypothetical protein
MELAFELAPSAKAEPDDVEGGKNKVCQCGRPPLALSGPMSAPHSPIMFCKSDRQFGTDSGMRAPQRTATHRKRASAVIEHGAES